MSKLRLTLRPEERAELDRLVALLPADERPLVRIVELFMVHEVGTATLLNEELRWIAARQAADLVDHEGRIRELRQQIGQLEARLRALEVAR
jgi:hypothetical protein